MAKKQVLIMITSLGFGHTSAANAISEALNSKHNNVDVTIVNPATHDMAPDLLKDIHDLYDESSKREGLYEILYKISDTGLAAMATDSAVSALLRDAVYSVIDEHKPDVIVCVHQDYLAPLKSLYEMAGFTMPIITVITDLTTIHRRWFNRISDITVVPTDIGYKLALDNGIREAKVKQIGIPVNPKIADETRPADEIRHELGWDLNKKTIIVVGSKRVSDLVDNLRGLNHSALDIQLVLIAGGDEKLYKSFKQTEWHIPVHIYNYVDNIPTMIKASDIVISKAGGLIVSETLACGKPLLITDVIEGQETGNAMYVLNNKAGDRAFEPLDVLEVVYHWLDDDNKMLNFRSEKAREIGRPNAAYDIADIVVNLAESV